MKKTSFFLILVVNVIFCISCDSIRYVHSIESTPYGVDFRKGKWLLNKVESPQLINSKLTKIAIDGFSKYLGDNLYYIGNIKSIALSYIPINPDSLLLKRIKKESQFDYLINIKSKIINDNYNKSITTTTLEIYDLNSIEIIYSRKIIGKHKIENDDSRDVVFAKGVNGIIVSSLKRIMRKLKR